MDILCSVQGRDLGGVAKDINKIVDDARKKLPRGSLIVIRGQVQTMDASFIGLGAGLIGAVVLVYLLIVVNFQSWTDPFIILTGLPGALAGISWMLFITGTTLSVPALMGAIMCVGVATANSILVVTFARERLEEHGDAFRAALEAGRTRLRPVLMTALAMIIGMVPMSLGLGEGGEQNAPLGRAVIGGLLVSTMATLFFVPVVFAVIRSRGRNVRAATPPPRCDRAATRAGNARLGKHALTFSILNATMDDTRHGRTLKPRKPVRKHRSSDREARGIARWRRAVPVRARWRRAVIVGLLLWKRSGEHNQLAADDARARRADRHRHATPAPASRRTRSCCPATCMAFNEASIFARTNGYLKSWSTDIGAKVTEGQVMAEIEAPDVDAQLRQAKATLAQAKANLEIANLNFDRQKDLLAKKVASQQEFDQNRTNVDAMKAAVQAGEANVQNLNVQKNFQQFKAPFDGIVTRRNTDVGALINASGGGQELFRIARTDILRVYVYVPQAYAAYRAGWLARAFLVFAEFPGEKFRGQGGAHRRGHRPGHAHAADGNPGGQQGWPVVSGRVRQRASAAAVEKSTDGRAGKHPAIPQGGHAGRRGR